MEELHCLVCYTLVRSLPSEDISAGNEQHIAIYAGSATSYNLTVSSTYMNQT